SSLFKNLKRDDVYNLKIGGSGGNPGIVGAFKGKKHSEEAKMKIREASLRNSGKQHTEESRRKMSQNSGMKRPEIREKVANSLRGRTQTEKHKNAVAEWNKGRIKVNNGTICKSITKEELENYIMDGWVRGMLPRSLKK
ncbi:MAG TPA: NUMOD3 domain-containing DNA-binding protein, partial [Methanosarcina sp.]|nr:NUMOD3 domain-containing DNA-binding protein [Methanosarcina sp.]